MPSQPEKKAEDLLKAYAQKRREQVQAPFELPPATRNLLQAEAARLAPKPSAPPTTWRERLIILWPRFAMSGAVFAALAVVAVVGLRTSKESAPALAAFRPTNAPADSFELAQSAPARPPVAAESPVALGVELDSLTIKDEKLGEDLLRRRQLTLSDEAAKAFGGPQNGTTADPSGQLTLRAGGAPRGFQDGLAAGERGGVGPSKPAGKVDREDPENWRYYAGAQADKARENTPAPGPFPFLPGAEPAANAAYSFNFQSSLQTSLQNNQLRYGLTPAGVKDQSIGPGGGAGGGFGAGASSGLAVKYANSSQTDLPARNLSLAAADNVDALAEAKAREPTEAQAATLAKLVKGRDDNDATRARAATEPGRGEALSALKRGATVSYYFVDADRQAPDAAPAEVQQRYVRKPSAPAPAGAQAAAGPTPAILLSFEFEQDGDQVRIIDADGSTYEGRLDKTETALSEARLAGAKAEPSAKSARQLKAVEAAPEKNAAKPTLGQTWNRQPVSFHASGTNRTLKQWVEINASFQMNPDRAVTESRRKIAAQPAPATPPVSTPRPLQEPPGLQNALIQGKAVIGGSNEVRVNAVPAQRR